MRTPLFILVTGWLCTGQGQVTNNWINPGSARWDSASSWSRGALPASNQIVNITNAGYKAVDIDSATVANFPGSMTVSNLQVSAPSGGLSTLLLNYTGLTTPLKVQNSCGIGANGTLQNLNSSLEVDGLNFGALEITGGGAFVQQSGLTVAQVPINIRSGSLALTNGNMTVGTISVGTFGLPGLGTMIQDRGSVAADRVAVNTGSYQLVSGTLYALNGTTVDNNNTAAFYQGGGTNYGDVHVEDGAFYALNSGMVHGNYLIVDDVAQFQQNAGLLQMEYLTLTGPGNIFTIDDVIGFYLRAGEAQVGTLTIRGYGLAEQDGGHLTLTNEFELHGNPQNQPAYYMLVNGILSSPGISISAGGAFNQRAGTNHIAGGLTLNDTIYYLPGGVLETTYTGVGVNAGFQQFRGAHYVNGVLSLSGSYDLLGGPLHVNGLYMRGTLNISDAYQQADFVNYGLTDLGGQLNAGSFVVFGQVRLSTNAVFNLTSGSARVYCANSSGVAWVQGMPLVISNWHNAGANAVFFGTDQTGLAASQLAQIVFSNPAGFSPGNYPAKILATGEIVPAPRPVLQSMRRGSALVLTWPDGYRLLSATNINGPFTPVRGATSPWTNGFAKPQEFFILQGL